MQITLTDYLGQYYGHPDLTAERAANAAALVEMVNQLLARAAADGVTLPMNPSTGTHISGQTNGGFRPQNCAIGAPRSTHKQGHGVDIYDPDASLAKWCYKHRDQMQEMGLIMENHRYTPVWTHLQDIPPGPPGSPWRIDYVPNNNPPLCAPLPEQIQNTKPASLPPGSTDRPAAGR